MKYNADDESHRKALADALKAKLVAGGFKLSDDRTLDPGRHYGGGFKGKEEVFVFAHRKDPGLEVQVFTSITAGGCVRAKGADAIRVALVYKNACKRQNPDAEEARQYTLGTECRVFRTGEVEDIAERTLERAREAYRHANEVTRCPRCQAPMATSRAGKPFCAEVCWLQVKG